VYFLVSYMVDATTEADELECGPAALNACGGCFNSGEDSKFAGTVGNRTVVNRKVDQNVAFPTVGSLAPPFKEPNSQKAVRWGSQPSHPSASGSCACINDIRIWSGWS
jgi:hypothetical protein